MLNINPGETWPFEEWVVVDDDEGEGVELFDISTDISYATTSTVPSSIITLQCAGLPFDFKATSISFPFCWTSSQPSTAATLLDRTIKIHVF